MPLWSTTPIKQECQITLLLSYLIHIIEKKIWINWEHLSPEQSSQSLIPQKFTPTEQID